MPYMSLRTSKPLKIPFAGKADIANIIVETIPGKSLASCMIDVQGECDMAFGDGRPACAFVDLRLFGETTVEAKTAFSRRICDFLQSAADIPPEGVYINFIEQSQWGSGGKYNHK